MSSIVKLSIRGIRSFGGEEEQSVNFTAPLTLIIGQNGSGKTTIIECLKYALTGDVPPGSEKGRTFVHDPKISHRSETLASVRLIIQDALNNEATVYRAMKLSSARNKITFQSLDGTISIKKDGKTANFSKSVAELNAEVTEKMGVSKAIINNVIFCHQEDSNWPLDEGKKVKERFDAIFGTTEYNKAVEKIGKMSKAKNDERKVKEADKRTADEIRKQAEAKRAELERKEKELEELQKKYDDIDNLLKEVQEQKVKILEREDKGSKIRTEQIELKTKVDNLKAMQVSCRQKIKNEFTGTMTTLQHEIREFDKNLDEKKGELEQLQLDLQQAKNEKLRVETRLQELDNKRQNLVNKITQQQDLVSERAGYIAKLGEKLNVPIDAALENQNETIDIILVEIRDAIEAKNRANADLQRSIDDSDHKFQSEIDKLRERKARLDADIASKRKKIEDSRKTRLETQHQIDQTQDSANQMAGIVSGIDKCKRALEDANAKMNIEAAKQQVAAMKAEKETLRDQLDKVDDEIQFLSSIASVTASLDAKRKEQQAAEANQQRVRNKHAKNFQKLFSEETVEKEFRRRVQNRLAELEADVKATQQAINETQTRVTTLEMERKSLKEQEEKLQKEVKSSEEKIFQSCQGGNYEEILNRAKENRDKTQMELSAAQSAKNIYQKYLNQIEEPSPCCPLCHKAMSNEEKKELKDEINLDITNLPRKIQMFESKLKAENKRYDNLLQLGHTVERVQAANEELPILQTKINGVQTHLATARDDLETLQMTSIEPAEKVSLINSMLSDMGLLDRYQDDLARIESEIAALNAQIPTRVAAMTMDEAQTRRQELSEQVKAKERAVDKEATAIEEHVQKLTRIRESMNKLETNKLQLQESVQMLPELQRSLDKLSEEIRTLDNEVKAMELEQAPLEAEVRAKEEEKIAERGRLRGELDAARREVNEIVNVDNEVKRCSRQISALVEQNLQAELQSVAELIRAKKQEAGDKERRMESLQQRLDESKTLFANQENLKRDLIENLELKRAQEEERKVQTRLDCVNADLENLDFRALIKEKRELASKEETLGHQRGSVSGQREEIKRSIIEIKRLLAEKKYREAFMRYNRILHEVAILKKIVVDLDKYRAALEHSLLKYHEEKMAQINSSIRAHWRQVYRGNDIDYIEIKTDTETQTGAKRRSYNYRVVMRKTDVDIDMRGRCSAGQKVLASLIIRMALAETFCGNCAVLALDEPTTNLDRDNITSLCQALDNIVSENRTHGKSMLIVITHDETFIKTMSQLEEHHRVGRNLEGKSEIERVSTY